jgi:amidase
MNRKIALVAATCAAIVVSTRIVPTQELQGESAAAPDFPIVEANIPQLLEALEQGQVDSRQLVQLYLERIRAFEGTLNAFITVDRQQALMAARERDRERRRGFIRGPLHGIPIVLKDNVLTRDSFTTGGALAFRFLVPPYESTLSQKLRDAGAIILGKTVMTELANWVSDHMPGNYSAVGRYGMNPYDPRRDPRHLFDASGHHFFDD